MASSILVPTNLNANNYISGPSGLSTIAQFSATAGAATFNTTSLPSTTTANNWGSVKPIPATTTAWENLSAGNTISSMPAPILGSEVGWWWVPKQYGLSPEWVIPKGNANAVQAFIILRFSGGQTINASGLGIRLYRFDSVDNSFTLLAEPVLSASKAYSPNTASQATISFPAFSQDVTFRDGQYLFWDIWIRIGASGAQTMGVAVETNGSALSINSTQTDSFNRYYMSGDGKGQGGTTRQAVSRAAVM